MTVIERWTSKRGVRIRYLDNAPSEPQGLPILFVPGLTDFADEYLQVLEFFSPRRILVVEVRGRGRSEAPATGYSVADHVDDLWSVIEAEQLDRFHLMTFSRGTSWSLELAMDHPERIVSMCIGDYLAFEYGLEPSFVESSMAESRFRGKPFTERIERHVLVGLQQASQHRQLWDRLADLPFPILAATGTEPGCLMSPETIARYLEVRPDVEIVIIPGSGHDLFRPDRLAYPRAVVDFLERRVQGT